MGVNELHYSRSKQSDYIYSDVNDKMKVGWFLLEGGIKMKIEPVK